MAINYLEIKKQIRQKLSKPIDFEDTDNLLELGLSSLVIMKLVNQWRKQGISHYLHLEQKDSIVNHIIKWIRDLDEGKRNCSK